MTPPTASNSLEGKYVLCAMSDGTTLVTGADLKTALDTLYQMAAEEVFSFELKADGTCIFTFAGQTIEEGVTWDEKALYAEGEPLPFTVGEDGSLSFDMDGSIMIVEKQ